MNHRLHFYIGIKSQLINCFHYCFIILIIFQATIVWFQCLKCKDLLFFLYIHDGVQIVWWFGLLVGQKEQYDNLHFLWKISDRYFRD